MSSSIFVIFFTRLDAFGRFLSVGLISEVVHDVDVGSYEIVYCQLVKSFLGRLVLLVMNGSLLALRFFVYFQVIFQQL